MTQLVGLERSQPYLALGGKIKQREVDQMVQYVIAYPSNSASAVVAECSGTAALGTVAVAYLDYPRSLRFKFVEASGTAALATATITGNDQFGNAISEVIACDNLGTGSSYGTKVFAYVGTVAFTGASRAAGDDMAIGYSDAASTAIFGLPFKIGAVNDIVSVNWSDNATLKPGTVTVDTALHAVKPLIGTISPQDMIIIQAVPTYNTDDNNNAGTAIKRGSYIA